MKNISSHNEAHFFPNDLNLKIFPKLNDRKDIKKNWSKFRFGQVINKMLNPRNFSQTIAPKKLKLKKNGGWSDPRDHSLCKKLIHHTEFDHDMSTLF